MRKLIIAVAVVLVVAVAAVGGWWGYRHVLHDPVATARDLLAHGDLRGAQLELRNAILKDPNNAEAHYELGRLQLRVGDAVAAEKELKAARAHGSKNAAIVPMLAKAYLQQQKFLPLLKEFTPAGLPPADAASLLVSRSLAQLSLQDVQAARASATIAERLAPTLPDAPLAIARVAATIGDRAQALLKVDEALKLDPKLLEALGLKADLQRGQGDLAGSLLTLDAAVAAAPYLPQVRLARARALLIAGEDTKAREDIEAALKVDPKSTLGLFLDALLQVRLKEWQNANVSLQKIQPVLGQLPRGEYYYALAKANVNQTEQALEAITHYIARTKGDVDAYRLLARIQLEMGHRSEATEALRRADDLSGNQAQAAQGSVMAATSPDEVDATNPESLTRMAEQQLDSGDTSGAVKDLEQSLEVQPSRAETGAAQVLSALAAGDAEQAQQALDRLARQPRAKPEVVGNLTGLVKMAELDFAGAQAAWEKAVEAVPTAVPARVNLARAMAMGGKFDAAEKVLTDILATQPANRAALRAAVEIFLADGKTDQAIQLVRAARKTSPNTVGLAVTEAALQARKADFAAAYNVLDAVPLEQALSPLVLNARAQFQVSQDKKQDAIDTYRQLLLNAPSDINARRRLIDLMMEQDKSEAAQKVADDGLAMYPGNAALLQLSVVLTYRAKGLDAALASIDKLVQEPITNPTARLLRGGLYMLAKKYPEAVTAYASEMKDMPFSTLVISYAAALRAAGKADEATQVLRDWLAKQPDPIVAENLASLDIESGRLDDAEKNLLTVLAVRPTDPVALNNLAWIYSKRNDKRGLLLAQRAYLLSPTGQSADTLGWILSQDKAKRDTALMLLRRAAMRLPSDATVHYHLAAVMKDAGETADAAKLIDLVIEKGGNFSDRDAALKLQAELGGKPK